MIIHLEWSGSQRTWWHGGVRLRNGGRSWDTVLPWLSNICKAALALLRMNARAATCSLQPANLFYKLRGCTGWGRETAAGWKGSQQPRCTGQERTEGR